MIKLKDLLLEYKIKSTDRIVMTNVDEIKFINKNQKVHRKPTGLWYGIGTSWIDWVEIEMPKWRKKHLFKIEINKSKVLVIDHKYVMEDFNKKYGVKYHGMDYIDWEEVAKSYSGIEINPYRDYDYDWYYGWDVASGCVWNKSGLKKVEKIK